MPLDRIIWLIVISILTFAGLFWGLKDTRRIIEAPFLYATGLVLILLPQLYVTVNSPWRVPKEAFWVFCTMVVACSIAFYAGYFLNLKKSRKPKRSAIRRVVRDKRLFKLGLFIGALGIVGYLQLYRLGGLTEIKVWRGWPVYWYTLSRLVLPGITMMLISYVQSKKIERLVLVLLFTIFPLLDILTAGRRSMTIELPIIYILPFLIYNRKIRIPRWAVCGAMILAFIVVYAFPYWRNEFKYGRYSQAVQDKPLSTIMSEMFSPQSDKVLEIVDGMIVTGAHYRLGRYEWGINALYNSLIELYVPGSLVGYDLKKSLKIGRDAGIGWVTQAYGIPVATYTAKSGFADLFAQYSFLGAVIMFFIGKLFRGVRDAVVYRFDGRAIIFLCFFITLPASVAYGAILEGIMNELPTIAIMIFSFSWCVKKYRIRLDGTQSTNSKKVNLVCMQYKSRNMGRSPRYLRSE